MTSLKAAMKNALPTTDDLFRTQKEREEDKLPKIWDIPLTEIDSFPGHPFQVRDDEDMIDLVDSVRRNGVMTPATVRRKDNGRYELVSGHRRKRACELAGLETLPCEIRELGGDEAVVMMVEANLQRSKILPSEKAFAYKMRLEAMKRQGERSDLTSTPVVSKFRSDEELGGEVGESREQIRRYIRLTNLVPELLKLVDNGKLKLRPAVELSYLSEDEQNDVCDMIRSEGVVPTGIQAKTLRKLSEDGELDADTAFDVLSEAKEAKAKQIKLSRDRLAHFFSAGASQKQIEDTIMRALEAWRMNGHTTEGG